MEHAAFAAYLLLCASLYALFEIQIEGKEGWAAALPTWRVDIGWAKILYGKRPLTGFHVFGLLFVFTVVHLPYALCLCAPSWGYELRILGFVVLFWVTEDFLWFVYNPHYGIRRFKAEAIWWHRPAWWLIMPRDYWIAIPLGLGLYLLSVRV